MQLLVAGLPPIRLSDVFGPAHRERPDTTLNTLVDDRLRECVVEVRLPF